MIGTYSRDVLKYFKTQSEYEILDLNVEGNKEKVKILIHGFFKESDKQDYPSLEKIIVPFSGKDGLDIEYLDRTGIDHYSIHGHSKFVAERAMSLLLTFMGNVIEYDKSLRKGDWSSRAVEEDRILWDSIYDLKIGIYGYGHIGKRIKDLILPFTKKIFTIKRNKSVDIDTKNSLEELVESVDILFISVPSNEYTKGSINKKIFKNSSEKVFVNVGRGNVVHEKDLFEALKENKIKAYLSDVWYNYPTDKSLVKPSNYCIEEFKNVLMTPHSASASKTRSLIQCKEIEELVKKIYGKVL